jgi:hypothetical protein
LECFVQEERVVYKVVNSAATLIQRTTTEAPQGDMYYIGLDVHKKAISYCIKDHLDGLAGLRFLVVTVHIIFQLVTVPYNLLLPLLKRCFHVIAPSVSHIGPQRRLLAVALFSSDVLLTRLP